MRKIRAALVNPREQREEIDIRRRQRGYLGSLKTRTAVKNGVGHRIEEHGVVGVKGEERGEAVESDSGGEAVVSEMKKIQTGGGDLKCGEEVESVVESGVGSARHGGQKVGTG